MTTNPTSILRAILNRRSRPARINGQLNAAIAMCEAIKIYAANPNIINLQKFTEKENDWLKIVGENNKAYADDLWALTDNGKQIPIEHKIINSPHNEQYDPPYGYVYGMTSLQYPRLIKLGATSRKRHPQDRKSELIKKYALPDLKISFFCEVQFPAKAEREWTLRYKSRRAQLHNFESREWFLFGQAEAQLAIHQIVKDLKLKEYGKWFLSPEIRKSFESNIFEGRKALLGTLNKLSDD